MDARSTLCLNLKVGEAGIHRPLEIWVFRRICGQNGGLVVPRQTHRVPVLAVFPCSPLWWVETGPRGAGIRPSLRSERVHHARSVPAVNPLRGSSATLRSFG